MTIAGELINVLGFRLEGEDNLRRFNQGMDTAEQRAKSNADKIKSLGVAAGIATTAMITMGTKAVTNAAAFERQMTRIGITAGSSAEQVALASETVQRLARDFAMPIDQAVTGLDTLVASGMSLESAMSFLPSVLATAQAAGAATADIANTAIKTSSALKIEASSMQAAFDVMVAGGKAGQFELKDMAQYIPDMANQFANLGYQGEEGLKRLIAVLQTLREDTGSASAAATNATNIFSKMFSAETEKNFKEFGVNIREEMAAAQKSGEDAISAYVRLTQEVLDKNPTAKISDLFADQQFQQGMLSLITSTDRLKEFFAVLNSAEVDGGVFRDLGTVLDDTQAKIDRMSSSFDMFWKAAGAALSKPVGSVLDAATDYLTFDDAIDQALEKRGMSSNEKATWRGRNLFDSEERGRAAREGGYAPTLADRKVREQAPEAYKVLGRYPQRPQTTVARPEGDQAMRPQMDFPDAVGMGADAKALFDQIAAMNSNLAGMAEKAAGSDISQTVTDARQDNRQFPVTVNAPVTVNVTQAAQAPAAVGAAVGDAVGKAATQQATRIESEPAQP